MGAAKGSGEGGWEICCKFFLMNFYLRNHIIYMFENK